jgi:hypothetical protein
VAPVPAFQLAVKEVVLMALAGNVVVALGNGSTVITLEFTDAPEPFNERTR